VAERPRFVPSPEQLALWPEVSGNAINGVGEPVVRQPSPIYWHDPDATPHGKLQRWFYARPVNPLLLDARAIRARALALPVGPLAPEPVVRPPEEWTAEVKRVARASGADLVGVAQLRPEWVFQGHTVAQKWIVMLGVGQDYEAMKQAPAAQASAEVTRQYARGTTASKGLATWLRSQGHEALPHGGPLAGSVTLIPPALACGFGELGKHGSIIHRELGASFRLACVLTDVPLVADVPDDFGADDFCTRCRLCEDACPPGAIADHKQTVRGVEKWYVDFDKCLPYFNENMGCAICMAVCPWSRPGVAGTLLTKLAKRRAAPK
jgi:Pyruvate/2-oxoacid:ferredoxin oxidoreductase delta subunit